MFTVVVAEKEHIDSIREYEVFLKPFIDDAHVEFCEWRPEEDTLADSVPHLVETVARERDWRAVVLCDTVGMERKNPFNRVEFTPPVFIPLDSEDEEEPEEGFDFGDEDSTIYEVTCSCGNVIDFDEETLEKGSIVCPNCGETLEFSTED